MMPVTKAWLSNVPQYESTKSVDGRRSRHRLKCVLDPTRCLCSYVAIRI